ncbi:probable serine/threonine-protein kinase cdc7 [Dendrobium catenatum]|uniref:non-specific serine/threonine protein kinase n=1 Tax=Dendrobium catenatum TaxID=906689 RepID=A0A2I0X106_9ASPA|nr:probable serine/threonine-protein kinase cdc7 [Dendrobium catenatum]PKU81590.1 Cyclin-dependent kinase F-4 [Dendrobium catenatum]
MEATGTISDIAPINSMDIETSLHLLAVLMRQGNPAGLAELALRSPIVPDLMKSLCQVLRSPSKFTSGGFMSSSNVAVDAFEEFMTRAVAWYVPRDTFRDSGLRRGRWNVSVTYVRKRKAPSSGNASVLFSRSKRRTLMIHERDEGEPMKVEGLPKLSSLLNEIPGQENFEVASPLGNDWHSVGPRKFDCSVVGLEQAYNFPVVLHGLNCFESRNISCTKQGYTRAGDAYIANSVFPHKKVVGLYEKNSPDVELDANIIKEQALQRLVLVGPDFRPLSDQTSPVNQTLGEDCNTISLELGFFADVPETPVLERPNNIELNFGTSLMDGVLDQTALDQLDYNNQSASRLACCYQQVANVVNERKLHSKDDALITVELETKETPVDSRTTYFHRKETSMMNDEFIDVGKNSAVIAEDKQWTFSEPCIKDHIASVELQNLMGSNIASNSTSSTKEHNVNFQVGLIAKQKVKNVCNVNLHSKENRVHASTKITKNSSDQKLMPNLESFIIVEEEGSGGYGTVYKAKRKDDGKIFAVKCPHANANSHHVYNELKMLERFGGRNFVIKYECSFKNGESECFVLEHVEHDRPEILKKEIGMFELQWYGFCMFKALASLHKQGVVHRDVKPGNFLFSRKVNKGYLIDFNLASDLQQKFCRNSKRKMPTANVNPNSLPETKSRSNIHSRKFIDHVLLENARKETANESKKVLTSKNSKKKAQRGDIDGFPIVDRSKQVSQTADGSGLTSTKDQTSNRTPVDWLKQPIPCKGRKELINFVHKAMHSPQNLKPVSNGPSSQRKRVAAPMTKTDSRLLILTPMPLHSGGNPVAGAGILRNKASGKVKREGPCVGTKGFRAPEVLFKSFHQGCKIDIWSAGVTMLYLMIGRAPFGGDPEQNIKEIAKLRGSEDLWEVAKLHNCESSFPVDLLEVGSLKSMELSDWCVKNTRRPEFLELIPESLFDLVDKCLAVNPRRRFSAEEALMHEFFAPCHESIRKQRLLRKVVTTSDPSSSNS